MDRLTGDFKGASMFATVEQARQYNRLRQYEDTGLMPDEIDALRDENDRLCAALKLAQTRAADMETEFKHLVDANRTMETEVERLRAELERLTAELAAMTARAEALEATTRSRDTRPCHWPVRIGDTFNGRKIVGADYGAQTITIDWRGPVEKGVSTDAD
jgi:septal ring factor EnvC (AmiA/AmiB activator)